MKRYPIYVLILLLALSCAKDAPVRVTAAFTTNKDVYQVGEEILIRNESTVDNDILAFCKWAYGNSDHTEYAYALEFEGLSFDEPGLYSITLTAYAEQGAGEDTCTRLVKVVDENDRPWADFSCPDVVKVGEEVVFEDKSVDHVGGIASWDWQIGAHTSRYQSPVIVFDAPQKGLVVKLTVTDAYGLKDSQTKTIDVTE